MSMAISIKYTKGQYLAKVAELEGYYNQLNTHLGRMEELKAQMFHFWDDAAARETGQVLAREIRSVKSAMDMTRDTLIFYKSAIEKLDGANLSALDIIGEALGILGGSK